MNCTRYQYFTESDATVGLLLIDFAAGLSSGAVVGLTFGLLALFIVTSLVLMYLVSKWRRTRLSEASHLNFDNPNYMAGSELELQRVQTDKQ